MQKITINQALFDQLIKRQTLVLARNNLYPLGTEIAFLLIAERKPKQTAMAIAGDEAMLITTLISICARNDQGFDYRFEITAKNLKAALMMKKVKVYE